MALGKIVRRNYGGKSPVSIKYQNLHSFKEGVILLCQSILETRRITHLHGSALFTIPLLRIFFSHKQVQNKDQKKGEQKHERNKTYHVFSYSQNSYQKCILFHKIPVSLVLSSPTSTRIKDSGPNLQSLSTSFVSQKQKRCVRFEVKTVMLEDLSNNGNSALTKQCCISVQRLYIAETRNQRQISTHGGN